MGLIVGNCLAFLREEKMGHETARFYIHGNSVGDFSRCRQVYDKYAAQISHLFESQKLLGYQFVMVENQEEVEDELIWCDYEKVTTNQFPFVCSVIQSNGSHTPDLDGMMGSWNFTRCAAG